MIDRLFRSGLWLLALPGSWGSAHAARRPDIPDLLRVTSITDVRYSPDGGRLLYETVRADPEAGTYRIGLWLVSPGSGARALPIEQSSSGPYESNRARWTAQGDALVYIRIRDGKSEARKFTISSGADELVLGDLGPPGEPRRVPPDSFQLSPDAATAAAAFADAPKPADPTKGIEAGLIWPYGQPAPNAGLWLKPLPTGAVRRVTPPELHVTAFAWSPDSTRIAFCAAPSPRDSPYKDDLYLLVVATGKITPLVRQPGWDRDPVWSPDGRRIAFISQRGVQDWNYKSWVAVVSAEGGAPRYLFDGLQRDSGSSARDVTWTSDGEHLLFWTGYHFDRAVFRGTIASDEVEQLTPVGNYARAHSLSPDGRRLAAVVESVARPAELAEADLPWREPRVLTRMNPDWDQLELPRIERVQWRSRDDRFDVHGLVIEPPDFKTGQPRPTIVYLAGGPSMVRDGFDLDEEIYPHVVLAANGYVVFAPNSRGRRGFGVDFLQSMPDAADFMPGPWEDVMAGVDELVRRGIADPERLALAGFSYGGGLVVYGAAHSRRFKAAALFEGFPNTLRQSLRAAGLENGRLLMLHQRGLRPPWEPGSFETLLRNSPIFALDRDSPPMLLEFGADSAARDEGNELYSALQYLGVPSAFIVYPHTGHGIDDPRLRADSYARQLAWFDRWLKR